MKTVVKSVKERERQREIDIELRGRGKGIERERKRTTLLGEGFKAVEEERA